MADAVGFEFEPFDFAVCFLVLMFLPVDTRGEFLRRLQALTKPGGALVIVDKVQMSGDKCGNLRSASAPTVTTVSLAVRWPS
jgi:chemotaxis methyl-accepting protein methylase